MYVSCNQLPNYPLGRYRSSFYGSYLSNSPIFNELTLSVNSSTTHQLETCLNSFIEHSCYENSLCKKYSQLAKKILVEQQQQIADDSQALSNTLRSVGDRKLNRYREQVFIWLKQICEEFITSDSYSTTKITDYLLQERLIPMTRATFIRELTETNNCKQAQIPDLALLFRIYTESGTKIPLSDWFEVRSVRQLNYRVLHSVLFFSHSQLWSKSEKFWTMMLINPSCKNDHDSKLSKTNFIFTHFRARFVHGLAELDYLGFTKTSLQRSYHATKLTWDA